MAMGVVDEFIARYRREQDFYEHAARLVAQQLESRIQAEGIRALVNYRAKRVASLDAKVRDRALRKNYVTVDDIYNDIVDLAGVRVALYFPGQDDEVARLIEELFTVAERKDFPDASSPKYEKRFSGYSASHYRVRLRDATLSDPQKRYADAPVEIQVASVLMHAWAEVEHDLVYKPLQGELSLDEYSVLDELNGLVIAGELALERLQRASEARVSAHGRAFSNHYELATHLLREATAGLSGGLADAALGRVDLLFDFLSRLEMAKPEHLAPFLENLHEDFELRPLAEQIIDQVLAQDPERYRIYDEVRGPEPAKESGPTDVQLALHVFMQAWIAVEVFVQQRARATPGRSIWMPSARVLDRIGEDDPEVKQEFERIRRMRNNVVHGVKMPPVPDLLNAAKFLIELLSRLQKAA